MSYQSGGRRNEEEVKGPKEVVKEVSARKM